MSEIISNPDIKRLSLGDKSAFNLVYEQFSGQVYRLAFRFLKSKELSEEIVQETFIKLWLNRAKLDEHGNIWLYLYVIAKRLSFNSLRKINHSAELFEELLINIKDAHNHTEEEILAADLERFTEKVLNNLPKQQQLVFKLSRIEGLSHKEIAEKLHISPNTVKNHMVEALKTIRASLNRADLIYFLTLFFLLE